MQMQGFMGGFYRISEWIWRFCFIHILWFIFLIPGLFVFGLFPSTAAMFAVMRKWVRGEEDIPVFKTFWASYKAEFIKSNILGFILLLVGYILFIDLQFVKASPNEFVRFFHIPLIMLIIMYGLLVMYIFPVFVHYDVKLFQVVKNAFLLMIMFPVITVVMGIGCYLVYFIMIKFPGLILVFGGSFYAFTLTWGANLAFRRLEFKHEEQTKKDEEQKNENSDELDENLSK